MNEEAKSDRYSARFGAFVMTFNRADMLPDTLRTILRQEVAPEKILVIDNASTDNTSEVVADFGNPRVQYMALPENIGPAGAASKGIQWAREEGFDWVYWGDDDDPPHNDLVFKRLFDLIDDSDSDDIGAIGTTGAQWNWKTGKSRRLSDDELHGLVEVAYIGGGQTFLISKQALERTSPPTAELFWGWEELDYCLRIKRDGLKVVIDGEQMLEKRQQSGRTEDKWSPQRNNIRTGVNERSPRRQYYSTRNYIFIMRKTLDRPDFARKEALRSAGRCLQAWARGPRYGARFSWFQIRAVIDGYLNRMGNTVSLR